VVPIPTLAEQQAVLKVVDSLTSQMTNLEAQIETAMQQSDALRQSILKRAFSGQLVVQDPSDEPASILLERIRSEWEKSGTTKRRNNKNGKKEAA
jgi:type I restriction enzyme, S subunit